jgi:hypothetical protein
MHDYDDPEISALNFLLTIMHDRSLPIDVRIDAAGKALPFVDPPLKPSPIPRGDEEMTVTVRLPTLFNGDVEGHA